MSQKNFAITPSVSISRSKFKRPTQHKTTFNLGDIVPIYLDADILPGDTVSMNLASLVRMSTPIAPIMDNIYIDYYAFFVPNRLVWTSWKQFMGENTSSFGAASEPTMPDISIVQASSVLTAGSLGNYLGLPIFTGIYDSSYDVRVSALPGRAYFLIYNEWFRDQNLVRPWSVPKDSTHAVAVNPVGNVQMYYNASLLKAAKESDYFTRALPYAQKGSPVSLPLGDIAKLKISDSYNLGGNASLGETDSSGNAVTHYVALSSNSYVNGGSSVPSSGGVTSTNLVADLSNATAATINQLRFAFQYQKFLEKDAQIFKKFFGVFNRASLNRAISVNA